MRLSFHVLRSLRLWVAVVALATAAPAARAQDPFAGAGNPSANIDQARNGTAAAPISPVHFQNGNAGAQNSHYLEGLSIPYRVRLEGLGPGSHTVTIGWDIRQGGRNALDYVTGPDRLEPHAAFLPPHPREVVDPLEGLSGAYAGPTRFGIPAPVAVLSGQPLASFNALPTAERELWMYNGTVTNVEYVPNADGNMGDLAASASESRMRVTFTAEASSVVLAFGGHIASQFDWGPGNSASAINGSPYHARVISLDGASIGNQDRSLSADAVLGCNITGPDAACPGSVVTFSETSNEGSAGYLWSFAANSSGAHIVGGNTGSSVQVDVGSASSGSEGFTLQVQVTSGKTAVTCTTPFTVTPGPRVSVDDRLLCPGGTVELCASASGGDGAYAYRWSNGATTPCITVSAAGTYTVTVTDGRGCSGQDAAVVTLAPPVDATISGSSSLCPEGSTTYTGPAGMTSYQWSVTGGVIVGASDGRSVEARAGSACGSTMVLSLVVTTPEGCRGASQSSVAVQDTKAPVFQGVGGPLTVECPATPVFSTPTATDECGGQVTITSRDTRADGRCAGEVVVTRTWTATDPCGNAATASQSITVTDRTAPVFAALPEPSTIECPSAPQFAQASATDACDAAPVLTYRDVTTPGACAGDFTVTRTWTATDACGNASTASQVIHVVDRTAPVIQPLPAASTIECPASPQWATPVVTDACDAAPRVTWRDETTPGDCPGRMVLTRTWTATDACGNASTATQVITVVDLTAPVFAALPPPSTIECPATPTFTTATVSDACDPSPTLTWEDRTDAGSCAGRYTVTRTWTAVDACGNRSTASQVITVRDVTPPALTLPADLTVGLCQNPVHFSPSAVDGCGGPVTVVSTPASGSTFPVGTTTVTVVARDACGNEARGTFQVTVLPNPSGTITGASIACPGGSATLTGPPGYRYRWSTGETTRSIVVWQSGTYTLTLTDPVTGCTTELSRTFTIVDPPVATISGPDRFCDGATAQLCGPSGPYRYAWSGPNGVTAKTRCVTIAASGTWQLVVTDTLTGCVSAAGTKSPVATFCYKNCPHTIGWWMAQCDGTSDGAVKYTEAQLRQIFSCVDDQVRIFQWTDDRAGFCAVINPDGNDQRLQAKRQYAGLLANVCTSQLAIRAENRERILIDLDTRISFPGLDATTIGELLVEVDERLMALETLSLDDSQVRNAYTRITNACDAINNNRIPDSYCPADQHVTVATPSAGPGLSPDRLTTGNAGAEMRFERPWPNPFTDRTRLAYAVEREGMDVDVAVFDLAGRRVRQLDRGARGVGRHDLEWDGRDDAGRPVRGGLYFLRARLGSESRLVTLVRIR